MDAERTRADDTDARIAHFVAVAIRTDDDARAPLFGQPRDVGKCVPKPGRNDQSSRVIRRAAFARHGERFFVSHDACDRGVNDIAAVALDFAPAFRRERTG
jgi:hypothetical protein